MAISISLHNLSSILFISLFLLFFPSSLSNRCPSHESQALLRVKAAINYSSTDLISWVNGTDCCTWIGISCDHHTNHVVSVQVGYFYEGVISESLCQLRFLTSLGIEGILRAGTTIPTCLGNISSIVDLTLNLVFSLKQEGIPPFVCLLTRLRDLDLSKNNFNGTIPSCLGNLSSLTFLDLSGNRLSGNIPDSLGNVSFLKELDISNNQLSGTIPHSFGNLSLLEGLAISNNQLSGIPSSFAKLSSITVLEGDGNHFNETISSSLPPSLVYLCLSLNHYQTISETFFHNLASLNSLYLSDCVVNISTTWIPSFQLYELSLVSCMIYSEFPPWISTQFSLHTLELTNTSLVGVIPSWLWETNLNLQFLNLSENYLEGSLSTNTSIGMHLIHLDVSRNRLNGNIPSMWSHNISILILNDNLFSGNIPPSLGKLSQLVLLNLANNNISGVIPVSLSNCSSLIVLNLRNNILEGSLPHDFSNLSNLNSLVVHSNKLNGSFPLSLENCSMLQVLDIGNNLFGGKIPRFNGKFYSLRVLVMEENNFIGNLPLDIGKLNYLQILLLSSNHISGSIPHTITLSKEMTMESQYGFVLSFSFAGKTYREGLHMISKGRDEQYQYILSTLTSIDLSNNEFEGEVVSNFENLKGLLFLNLSTNNLNGTIPSSLGEMSQLESLDLSRNKFSGQIPAELDSLNSLGFLNLSNNNLSGCIPQGKHMTTFVESSYLGNPNLWGCPLPKNCSWPQFVPPPLVPINKEKKSSDYPWYGITLGLSYGVAFGGILSLILIKISWRGTYFNKVDTILKLLFPWMKNLTI